MKNKIPIILAIMISLAQSATSAQNALRPEGRSRIPERFPARKMAAEQLIAIASARALPAKLDAAAKSDLEQTIKALKQGDTAKATEAWRNFVADYASPANRENIEAIIRYAMREGCLAPDEELSSAAANAAFIADQRKAVRDHIKKLRDQAEVLQYKEKADIQDLKLAAKMREGEPAATPAKARKMSKEEIEALAKDWQQKLDGMKENAESAQLKLQSIMQDREKTIETISKMTKTMRETAMNVIRNMR